MPEFIQLPEESDIKLGMWNKRYVKPENIPILWDWCNSKMSILSNPDIVPFDMPDLEESH